MMTYSPLWETMKEKKVTIYALTRKHGVSNGTIWNLQRGKPIETTTIEKFCRILNCQVQNIVQYIPDPDDEQLKKDV